MSLLDMDERLLELAGKIEVVFSPLVDRRSFLKTSTWRWWKAR